MGRFAYELRRYAGRSTRLTSITRSRKDRPVLHESGTFIMFTQPGADLFA